MKLRDIIKNIDKSSKTSDWVNAEYLGSELGLPSGEYREQTRITSHYFAGWLSGFERVGFKVYFMDDEAVAVSTQLGRKSYEDIDWISEELATKVRDYLLTLLVQKEDKLDISLVDLDEELGEGFSNPYYHEIEYKDDLKYKGEKVKLVSVVPEEFNLGTEVIIEKENGEQVKIETVDLELAFYLKKRGC